MTTNQKESLMNKTMEKIPTWSLGYIINGDMTGLTDDEIRKASEAAVRAGVSYVKTGTGWAGKPTTVDTIRLIKSTIGDAAKIKAAGGVRTLDTMLEMIQAGCDRFGIGLRSIMSIMKEVDARLGRKDDFSLESCENDLY